MSKLDLDALAAVEVTDPKGDPRRLGDLWEDAGDPVVLVWLRHFG